jgi:1-acyl-sn-glycerol-3-phosphate acyltransferase
MIKIAKAILLIILIFLFIAIFALLQCLFFYSRAKRAFFISYAINFFSIIATLIMGVRIKVNGMPHFGKKRGAFLVTNHMSYIDGLVASRIFPLIFVARGDLKEWPLFGVFSKLSETVFINRVNTGNLPGEIGDISFLLKKGINVILFPQGTTTSSIEDVSFRSSLFQAPISAGCAVIPFTIKYRKINGVDINDGNKDLIFWYGDMEFVPHLFYFLSVKNIEVEIEILKPIEVSSQDDRKSLSRMSQEAINASLNS